MTVQAMRAVRLSIPKSTRWMVATEGQETNPHFRPVAKGILR
jgi:hypothetical protein